MINVLSFGDKEIVLLRGYARNKKIRIKSNALLKIDKDVINNGVINDSFKNIVSQFIKENIKRTGKINLVLNSNNIFYREITVPAVGKSRLNEIIKNEMLGNIGELENQIIDYVILKKDKNKKTYNILVFIVHKDIIKNYYDLFEQLKIEINTIDISSNALAKLFGFVERKEKVFVVMIARYSSIELMLIDEQFGILSRNIRICLDNFRRDDAIHIAFEEIAEHVGKIVQFQNGRSKSKILRKMYIIGDIEEIQSLYEIINSETGLTCGVFDISGWVKTKKDIPVSDYVCSMGAFIKRR